jgi:hypothetical protein
LSKEFHAHSVTPNTCSSSKPRSLAALTTEEHLIVHHEHHEHHVHPAAVYRDPMHPLSVTASVIGILQLTSKVIESLDNLKDAPRDRARVVIAASNLHTLLITLKYRLEGRSNKAWYTAVRSLGVQNGPLRQTRKHLSSFSIRLLAEVDIKRWEMWSNEGSTKRRLQAYSRR